MPFQATAAKKLAFVLFLMCAVVCAQAASLDQFHQHSNQHCCGLCHAGMPFVQPAASFAPAPDVSRWSLESSPGFDAPREVWLAAGSSRAPPAA
jgi:hypothetical protein